MNARLFGEAIATAACFRSANVPRYELLEGDAAKVRQEVDRLIERAHEVGDELARHDGSVHHAEFVAAQRWLAAAQLNDFRRAMLRAQCELIPRDDSARAAAARNTLSYFEERTVVDLSRLGADFTDRKAA